VNDFFNMGAIAGFNHKELAAAMEYERVNRHAIVRKLPRTSRSMQPAPHNVRRAADCTVCCKWDSALVFSAASGIRPVRIG
jgi:hypothetical protein